MSENKNHFQSDSDFVEESDLDFTTFNLFAPRDHSKPVEPEPAPEPEPVQNSKFLLLPVLIVVTTLFFLVTGAILKYTVCKKADVLQDNWAIAIPFVLMQDSTTRHMVFAEDQDSEPIITAEESQSESESATEDGTSESTEAAPEEDVTYSLQKVDDDYWSGVLFIGDSRTQGLMLYAPCPGADYFAADSIGPFDILDESRKITNSYFNDKNLEEALSGKQYHTIYIMLGINDLGHSMEGLKNAHLSIIRMIREHQEDTRIVLQANLRITKTISDSNVDLNIDRFFSFEEVLQEIAEEDPDVFYIDVNPLFCDEDGYFITDYTRDGSHPYAAHYEEWKEFLYENGVVKTEP